MIESPQERLQQALRGFETNPSLMSILEQLESIAQDYPDYDEVYGHLGWNYWRAGVHAASVENYKKLLKLRPDDYEARLLLGKVLFSVGLPNEAAAQWEKIVEDDRYHQSVLPLLAYCNTLRGHFRKARKQYHEIQTASPDLSPESTHRIQLLQEMRRIHRILRWILFPSMKALLLSRWRQRWVTESLHLSAEAATRYLILLQPESSGRQRWLAEFLLAHSTTDLDRIEDITNACLAAERLEYPAPSEREINLFVEREIYAAARPAYEKYRSREKPSYRLEMTIADACVASGDLFGAMKHYERASGETKFAFNALLHQGMLALFERGLGEPWDFFNKAIDLAPHEPYLRFLQNLPLTLECSNPALAADLLDKITQTEDFTQAITDISQTEAYEGYLKRMHCKRRSCALCGSESQSLLYYGPVDGWPVVQCNSCRLIYVNPVPDLNSLKQLYTHKKRSKDPTVTLYRRWFLETLEKSQLEQAQLLTDRWKWFLPEFDFFEYEKSLRSEKRVLDVGCSVGRFLLQFEARGWDAQGIDLDSEAVRFASEHGLQAVTADLEDAAVPTGGLDLITLFHVIEHVSEPRDYLDRIHDFLKPEGLLWLETPCAQSLPHYLCGPGWFITGEHLYYFGRKTLIALLERSGFEIRLIRTGLATYIDPSLYERKLGYGPSLLLRKFVLHYGIGDNIEIIAQKR